MLLRRTPSGRRGAVTASAAALCLASALTACGGGDGGGYTAVGAAGATAGPPGTSSGPTGSVTLVPLDGSPAGTAHRSPPAGDGPADTADTAGGPAGPAAPTPSPGSSGHDDTRPRQSAPPAPDPSRPSATSPTGAPTGTAPPGHTSPAALTWSAPTREPTDKRWCEKVTVEFRNSGGTAVRSGTVTLGTHIIGLLGIDWATIGSTRPVPAPVAAGARTSATWTICVDDWRVPLGMHIETRVVTVDWN